MNNLIVLDDISYHSNANKEISSNEQSEKHMQKHQPNEHKEPVDIVKEAIDLIRCHTEDNEARFVKDSKAIADKLDAAGRDELARYIRILIEPDKHRSFVPM